MNYAKEIIKWKTKTLELNQMMIDIEEKEKELRKHLWLNHNSEHLATLYGDDGEMQCSHKECMTDFRRIDIQKIINKHYVSRKVLDDIEGKIKVEITQYIQRVILIHHGVDYGWINALIENIINKYRGEK